MTRAWLKIGSHKRRERVVSILLCAVLVTLGLQTSGWGQEPPRHWHHAGAMPPGAIGSLRLLRGGPESGYFQPVQIRVPEGTRVALAVDGQFTEPTQGNALAGLLIGAVNRLRITNIPNNPGEELFPTIELIGRTYPPPGLKLRYPIPIELTADELEMAARGAFITRVIYVEDPSQALPIAQKPGQTEWFEAAPGEDPLVVADRLGRPIAILRIGGRWPDELGNDYCFTYGTPPVELYDESMVPADDTYNGGWPTYRLPCDDREQPPCAVCPTCPGGDACLSTPDSCCPQECAACSPIGPPDEYLCDGGDYGMPVSVRADWTVDGLEQEDAVAHFDTLAHELVIVPSNRVCVYAPRFAVVRRTEGPMLSRHRDIVESVHDDLALIRAREALEPATALQRYAVKINLGQQPPSILRNRQQVGLTKQRLQLLEDVGIIAPYANLKIVEVGILENNEKAWLAKSVESAITWAGDQAVQVVVDNREAVEIVRDEQVGVVYGQLGPQNPRLRLCKLASTGNAQSGQIVEFTLRYDNIGDQVIGNVTIVDNLSTRLEYVEDSAKSTREADFFTAPNDAGSLILRWEIKEPLEPGEGGVLQFKTLVR